MIEVKTFPFEAVAGCLVSAVLYAMLMWDRMLARVAFVTLRRSRPLRRLICLVEIRNACLHDYV